MKISIIICFVIISIIVYVSLNSQSYKKCSEDYKNYHNQTTEQQLTPINVFWGNTICIGKVLDRHNGIIVALATIIIAFFTATLWKVAYRQDRMSHTTERAFLHIVINRENIKELMKFSRFYNSSTNMDESTINGNFAITYRIKNYGKTPAIIKEICASFVCCRVLPKNPIYTVIDDIILRSPYLSSNNDTDTFTCMLTGILKKRETDEVVRGENTLWFYGKVIYDDVFGIEHEHRFIWNYNGSTNGFRPYNQKNKYNQNT